MQSRSSLVLLFAIVLMASPLEASQPAQFVGKLIANPQIEGNCSRGGFELHYFFNDRQIDLSEYLVLDLALIPFRFGTTSITLQGPMATSLLHLDFSEGQVNGLSYHRTKWNDVRVLIVPATQEYFLTVNGAQAGPMPFDSVCQQHGGCFTVNALHLVGLDTNGEEVAWLDSLSLIQAVEFGEDTLVGEGFTSCFPQIQTSQALRLGGVLIVQ